MHFGGRREWGEMCTPSRGQQAILSLYPMTGADDFSHVALTLRANTAQVSAARVLPSPRITAERSQRAAHEPCASLETLCGKDREFRSQKDACSQCPNSSTADAKAQQFGRLKIISLGTGIFLN